MKTIEPPKFIINTIKNDDENIKHYIKSVSVTNDEAKIEFIMNTELLYGDTDYY